MKTLNQLQSRKTSLHQILIGMGDNIYLKSSSKDVKKTMAEIQLLETLIRYVETNPEEDFILAQFNEAKRKIEIIEKRYEHWKSPQGVDFKNKTARKKYYLKSTDYAKQKSYVETLGYLLGK